jgi:hypothetical protein
LALFLALSIGATAPASIVHHWRQLRTGADHAGHRPGQPLPRHSAQLGRRRITLETLIRQRWEAFLSTSGRGGEFDEYDLLAVDVAVTDDDSAHV